MTPSNSEQPAVSAEALAPAGPSNAPLRWYWSLVPPLFALAPLLTLYANNATEVSFVNALSVIAGLTFGAWMVSAVAFALMPARRGAVVIAASVLTALFFYYGYLFAWLDDYVLFLGPVTIGPNKIVAVAMVLSVVLAWRVSRRSSETLSRFAQIAAAIGLTLVVAASVPAFSAARYVQQDDPGQPDAALSTPAPQPGQELPDVYLLILDSYASNEALETLSDYDNTPFTNWLTSEGFYVVDRATSNYSWTVLSVPATLNMRYMNDDARDLEPKDRAHLDMLTQQSTVVRALSDLGYRYTHVASGLGADNLAPLADEYVDVRFNEMFHTALSTTALSAVGVPQWLAARDKYLDVTTAFDVIERVATTDATDPQLVVAHMMAPRSPNAFTADGELDSGMLFGSTRGSFKPGDESYTDEITAINRMVQDAFETIERESDRPFVVIVQGDHGYSVEGLDFTEQERYLGRHGVLNAIYFSDGGYDELYPTMSLVNTFRVVFNRHLGTELPLLEDRAYFSEYAAPYDLTDVTDDLTR